MAHCNALKPGEIDLPARCSETPGHHPPHAAGGFSIVTSAGALFFALTTWEDE